MTSPSPRNVRADHESFTWAWTAATREWVPPAVDPTTVSAARIYDYLLGGKDNFEVDRAAAEQMLLAAPHSRRVALANRRFLHRAVEYLVGDCGIRQLIDLGTGIPTSPSVHEVARAVSPDVRVVYVDNDPVVIAHARAVLATEPGIVTLLHDLRDPDGVLGHPVVRGSIDFSQPVGLLFAAVLHFVAIDQAPSVIARYRETVATGSGLAISALCREHSDPVALRLAEAMYEDSPSTLYPRSTAQVEQLFEGFTLRRPLAPVREWGRRPEDDDPEDDDVPVAGLAGVGIKS